MNPVTTPEMMTPAEVAAAFRVDPKTVTRWANAGRLSSIRTLGGVRRFYAEEVRALLAPAGQAEIARTAYEAATNGRNTETAGGAK
jgi:excisionase family DNA binding protein